jgi:Cu/Ag efflux protein CusF
MEEVIMFRIYAVGAVLAVWSAAVFAQAPSTPPKGPSISRTVTVSAVIKAIDHKTRSITLRADTGEEETFTAGPEVTRFDQLKAGDTIRATYSESLVVQVRKPGGVGGATAGVTAGRTKETPGGYVGAVQTATVTVKSVDMAAGSITVSSNDGRTLTRRVADKKNLEGIKPGDQLDITYTQSLLVNAEAKK